MSYRLSYPIKEFEVNGVPFGKRSVHNGELWGIHLGEDCIVPAGTDVFAIANGKVVYSALHAGDENKGNWGYITIIEHHSPLVRKKFYSLYGHLGACYKRIGERVKQGEPIGFVGKDYTAENGYWLAHLHFAIYTGPWKKQVLPGYWKEGDLNTDPKYWRVPSEFVREHQRLAKDIIGEKISRWNFFNKKKKDS
jgi:murein DD-endopeptidase MepM/ murein hydrolase activator NlpD